MDQQLLFIATQVGKLVAQGASVGAAIADWSKRNNHYLNGNEEVAITEFLEWEEVVAGLTQLVES